jgi:hypothetical protein
MNVNEEQHNETHHTLFKKGGRAERGDRNIMEAVNLFKVYCTHVYNYHSKTPQIINVC